MTALETPPAAPFGLTRRRLLVSSVGLGAVAAMGGALPDHAHAAPPATGEVLSAPS